MCHTFVSNCLYSAILCALRVMFCVTATIGITDGSLFSVDTFYMTSAKSLNIFMYYLFGAYLYLCACMYVHVVLVFSC